MRATVAATALTLLYGGAAESEASRHLDPCDSPAPAANAPEPAPQKRARFEVLPDVDLSQKVEDKLVEIARGFQKRTGKTFVVTSGTRGPEDQAAIIHDKLARGEDLNKLYRDKAAVLELRKLFDAAKTAKRSREASIALLAGAIRAQMKRGVFISAHLRAGAADVRSSSMEESERRVFLEVAKDAGGISVMHESSPPHFHLQLE
jgi:hypothetical protein